MPQHRGMIQSYGKFEDTKGVNRNPKYNDQKKKDIKTIIYKTLHRKFKMNLTKTAVNLGTPVCMQCLFQKWHPSCYS